MSKVVIFTGIGFCFQWLHVILLRAQTISAVYFNSEPYIRNGFRTFKFCSQVWSTEPRLVGLLTREILVWRIIYNFQIQVFSENKHAMQKVNTKWVLFWSQLVVIITLFTGWFSISRFLGPSLNLSHRTQIVSDYHFDTLRPETFNTIWDRATWNYPLLRSWNRNIVIKRMMDMSKLTRRVISRGRVVSLDLRGGSCLYWGILRKGLTNLVIRVTSSY